MSNWYKILVFVLWCLGLVNLLAFGAWLPASYTALFWALPSGTGAGQVLAEIVFEKYDT